jgi:hypothetical protein
MGGAYVNFMMEERIDRIKATYRDNYDRLVKIKRKYDPDNFFHVNQNIRTAIVVALVHRSPAPTIQVKEL